MSFKTCRLFSNLPNGKTMKKHVLSSCLVALAWPALSHAQSSPFVISTGVKAFHAAWETTPYDINGNLLQTETSDNAALALTPYISLRYGDFVTNFAYTPETSYEFGGFKATKTETDFSAGYAFGASYFLLGYKTVDQKWDSFTQNNAGLYLGYQVGGSISGAIGAYLNAAYSPAFAAKYPNGQSVDGTYLVGEIGLSYSLGPVVPNTKNLAFTVGARYQTVDTDDYKDAFSGLTFGVNLSF